MDRTVVIAFAAASLAGGSMWAWSAHGAADEPAETARAAVASPMSREPISPILPAPASLSPAKVALGKRLFSERRLSADGTVACSDCHDLALHGGADGKPLPTGIHGRVGRVNTPTIWNADANVRQFWDGRADSLEAQVDGPLLNQDEMGGMWTAALEKLREDPSYVSAFGREGISPTTVRSAIATYERTLVTPGSRFDRWLAGDTHALTSSELGGYADFKRYGCISCHQGRNVGGNMFETLGIMGDYFADRGTPETEADLGRLSVTKREEDRHRFRVPPLRLAARTAPYFHDGQVPTLEDAIRAMGKYQLGTEIPPPHIARIAAFIESLAP